MVYDEFECQACGNHVRLRRDHSLPHRCHCGGVLRRVYGFHYAKPFEEHFNHSLGKYVNTQTEFLDGLKRASETQSERLGIEHNFQPVDITDMKSLGVTDEGLDHTRQVHRDAIQE